MEHLTNEGFQKAIQQSGAVLVDFFATWCGPCKLLTPILEEVEEELAGALTLYKLNIDEAEETARACGIVAVPTLLLFREGKQIGKLVGYREKEDLVDWIHENI